MPIALMHSQALLYFALGHEEAYAGIIVGETVAVR